MTDLQKVKISKIITSARFWVIIFDLFLMTEKGFSKEQVFTLIGVFYFANVIAEFPTGVIGDYFSHKLSVILGYTILAISFVLFLLVTSFFQVVFLMFFISVGTALLSGSDTALVHAVSKDFKKDSVQLKIYETIVSSVALAIGSLIADFNFNYAFYLQSLIFVIAIFVLFSVKTKKQKKEAGNIFATAKEGFKNVIFDKYLFHLTIISSLTTAFFLNLKWFFNPLFSTLNIDLKLWGFLGGISTLFIILGSILYRKFPEKNIVVSSIFFLIFVFMMSLTKVSFLAIGGLFLINLIRGFFGVKFNVDTNKVVKPTVRSSVLSFQSFFVRIVSMAIVFISGFVLERFSFSVLIYVILCFLLLFGFVSVLKVRKFEMKTI